uniref:Uncharacterized protein n=1 Tax=Knipowitschia caucasica TaxID=637954 RepID=A0AAV2LD78_KNICA
MWLQIQPAATGAEGGGRKGGGGRRGGYILGVPPAAPCSSGGVGEEEGPLLLLKLGDGRQVGRLGFGDGVQQVTPPSLPLPPPSNHTPSLCSPHPPTIPVQHQDYGE